MHKMDKLIEGFIPQLKEALEIAQSSDLSSINPDSIRNVHVAGLGGSGFGANLVWDLVKGELPVPMSVSKGYECPAFVNASTLFIASSYSGNTEETLSAVKQAIEKGAQIVAISSGGELKVLAEQHHFPIILVPGGMPPRTCLGYSFVQQVGILQKLNLIKALNLEMIQSGIAFLADNAEKIESKAKELCTQLRGTIPIIYSAEGLASVALRFRQQINENSKMLCWHHIVPEMNHNEMVGWRTERDEWAVVIFRHQSDDLRNQKRLEVSKAIIKEYSEKIVEIWSEGSNALERALYAIHLGDWISFYLAKINGVDPVEVDVIDRLKKELGT